MGSSESHDRLMRILASNTPCYVKSKAPTPKPPTIGNIPKVTRFWTVELGNIQSEAIGDV